MSKEIDLLKIKKKAYSTLKKLKIAINKNNYKKYMKLKEDYNKLLRIINDNRETTRDEAFLWDKVRNKLDLAFSMKRSADTGIMGRGYYINMEIKSLEEFDALVNLLKKYLK